MCWMVVCIWSDVMFGWLVLVRRGMMEVLLVEYGFYNGVFFVSSS